MLTLAVLIAHLRYLPFLTNHLYVDLVTLIFLRSLLSATNACLDISLTKLSFTFADLSRLYLIDGDTGTIIFGIMDDSKYLEKIGK